MSTRRAYRARTRPTRSEQTRGRIMDAVRELLREGAFHESTAEQVAGRAGVSRATLYQHFRSRVDLVDSICDTFAVNPALVEIRQTVELPAASTALRQTIARAERFWASEDAVLAELYGVVAIDPAARALVDRQRADRRGVMRQLVRNLRRRGALRPGVSDGYALDILMMLTSYETFRELRAAGRSERQLTTSLQETAQALLLSR